MEGRMKKYMQVSPERAKVWKEKSPKYHYNQNYPQRQPPDSNKVPVVYYLCRNRELEHPHFMEVPLSSPDGLYLRDVIERLDVLRGRGMASTYSWSCKRSYKNGYVWHDLSYTDLILPAHGNEYVLKGSEFFEKSNSGRFNYATTITVLNQKALPEPPSSRSQEESSSSSSLNDRTAKSFQDDEQSPPIQRPCSSPEFSTEKNSSWNGPLSLIEYKVYKNDGLADASTQTEENTSITIQTGNTCTRGVSTDEGLLQPEICNASQSHIPQINDTPKICREFVSPPSTSSASSSGSRTDTLESLIRADAKKLNSFRILEEEEFQMPSSTRLKSSNMIMQLISCGSISVKDHSFGLIPTYKPRFSSKFPSPMFSTSLVVRELYQLEENPRVMRVNIEEREYFSGSLAETSMVNEVVPTLKRSNSDNAARSAEQLGTTEKKDVASLKCIPRSIKASLIKQPRSESMRSPLSEGPRISLSDRSESSRTINAGTPNGGSKRITEPEKKSTRKLDSSRNDKENVIKIEESLLRELGL